MRGKAIREGGKKTLDRLVAAEGHPRTVEKKPLRPLLARSARLVASALVPAAPAAGTCPRAATSRFILLP